jgi:hypothetical protein
MMAPQGALKQYKFQSSESESPTHEEMVPNAFLPAPVAELQDRREVQLAVACHPFTLFTSV